ncbi:hypothetical protein BST95_00505 [Halioglobus japonicus]|nr:hypothetical protein BST95_00505 [Halioglobus japonicus]
MRSIRITIDIAKIAESSAPLKAKSRYARPLNRGVVIWKRVHRKLFHDRKPGQDYSLDGLPTFEAKGEPGLRPIRRTGRDRGPNAIHSNHIMLSAWYKTSGRHTRRDRYRKTLNSITVSKTGTTTIAGINIVHLHCIYTDTDRSTSIRFKKLNRNLDPLIGICSTAAVISRQFKLTEGGTKCAAIRAGSTFLEKARGILHVLRSYGRPHENISTHPRHSINIGEHTAAKISASGSRPVKAISGRLRGRQPCTQG